MDERESMRREFIDLWRMPWTMLEIADKASDIAMRYSAELSGLNEQVAQLLENNRQLGVGQDRLRAELAAEKERVVAVTKQGEALVFMAVTDAVERCAKIAGRYCEMARDAIRASNAAPLESLPGELARHWFSEGGTPASIAAPPQPCSYPQYCGREVCNCPPDAAPAARRAQRGRE